MHSLSPASQSSETWGPDLRLASFTAIPPSDYSFPFCIVFSRYDQTAVRSFQSHLFTRLNKTHSLSLSSQDKCSGPSPHWWPSCKFINNFHVLTDLKLDTIFHVCSDECWVMIRFLDLLTTHLMMQPRMILTFSPKEKLEDATKMRFHHLSKMHSPICHKIHIHS